MQQHMATYIVTRQDKNIERIDAQSIELRDGCLLFLNADRTLRMIVNRDCWDSCERADNSLPHGV